MLIPWRVLLPSLSGGWNSRKFFCRWSGDCTCEVYVKWHNSLRLLSYQQELCSVCSGCSKRNAQLMRSCLPHSWIGCSTHSTGPSLSSQLPLRKCRKMLIDIRYFPCQYVWEGPMYSAEFCGSKAVHSMQREGYPSRVLPQMLLRFVNHESRLLLLCQERNHFMENACRYRSLWLLSCL